MRGRKPVPTAMKLLRGNPGKRPLNQREPKPPVTIPRCPQHLDAEARREWRRVSRELYDMGVLSLVDRPALAIYCQAWSRWVRAEKLMHKSGEVLKAKGSGALYQNPYLAVANKAMEQMARFLAEFGMTPVSRTRVHAYPLIPEAGGIPAYARRRDASAYPLIPEKDSITAFARRRDEWDFAPPFPKPEGQAASVTMSDPSKQAPR